MPIIFALPIIMLLKQTFNLLMINYINKDYEKIYGRTTNQY